MGKTTVADLLFQSYESSAFFDGDWAWCVNPFSVQDSRLRNGDRVMAFALDNYLQSQFDVVVFYSVVVMYEDIRRAILEAITRITADSLHPDLHGGYASARHIKRGDPTECPFHWLHELMLPGDHVIRTDHKSPGHIVLEMRDIIDAYN